MASKNGEREGRRKRIADRGSDRMALITGRINALPPTPPSHAPSPTHRNIPRHALSMSGAAGFDSRSEEHDVPARHQRPQSLSAFDDYNENLTGSSCYPTPSFSSSPFNRVASLGTVNFIKSVVIFLKIFALCKVFDKNVIFISIFFTIMLDWRLRNIPRRFHCLLLFKFN